MTCSDRSIGSAVHAAKGWPKANKFLFAANFAEWQDLNFCKMQKNESPLYQNFSDSTAGIMLPSLFLIICF